MSSSQMFSLEYFRLSKFPSADASSSNSVRSISLSFKILCFQIQFMKPSKMSIDIILIQWKGDDDDEDFDEEMMMLTAMIIPQQHWWWQCFFIRALQFVVCLCFQLTQRHPTNESDDADCNDEAMISFTEPVYKIPLPCLHQNSDRCCCRVPPIPPRKHIPMDSSQQDLFNWIPPPQSMSPAADCRSRTLAQSSSLRNVSRSSGLSLPR